MKKPSSGTNLIAVSISSDAIIQVFNDVGGEYTVPVTTTPAITYTIVDKLLDFTSQPDSFLVFYRTILPVEYGITRNSKEDGSEQDFVSVTNSIKAVVEIPEFSQFLTIEDTGTGYALFSRGSNLAISF